MKKILLFAAAALSFAGCAEDAPTPGPAGDAGKFAEMSVPSSFGWKTTASVACNFTAPQPTRVYVAAGQEAEPFASFMVGGDADPVKLDVPAATRTLYVSCRTESGVSPQVAVPVTSDGAFCSLDPKAASGTRAGIGNDDEASVDEGLIYIPARRNGWGTLMFEDLWPAYGDFDFNDFVVNYKIQLYMQNKNKVNAMLIGVRVKAVGGSIPYDLCLAMKGVKGGELKSYSSTLEETRADLFGLYYLGDPKMVELGLVPSFDVAKAGYAKYILNGMMTQLARIEPGKNVEESHMRNRKLICEWCYERGKADNVIEMVRENGKTYVVVNDYEKLRGLFGDMLREIQRIKSEGDYEAGRALVERYAVQVDPELHKEVRDRYYALSIEPYGGFVNPEFKLVEKDGKIVDVKISYPADYVKQMLGYSKDYSFLPNIN